MIHMVLNDICEFIYCSVDRQKGRLAGFSLYVSNSDVKVPDDIKKSNLCYKDGPELPPLDLTLKCMKYGRYVIFYNERFKENSYPEKYEVSSVFTQLCEVNIKGKQKPGVILKRFVTLFWGFVLSPLHPCECFCYFNFTPCGFI